MSIRGVKTRVFYPGSYREHVINRRPRRPIYLCPAERSRSISIRNSTLAFLSGHPVSFYPRSDGGRRWRSTESNFLGEKNGEGEPAGAGAGAGGAAAPRRRRRPEGGRGGRKRLRARLLPRRLRHLHHLRLQPRRDERGAEVRAGGPGDQRLADRAAHRRHQHLLPRRLAGGGVGLRPRRPPPHHGALRGHVLRGLRTHRRRLGVRRAHGRPARRRRRLRVRPRRRARLHRRDGARRVTRLPLLHPRDCRQLGHPAQLHRRLRARGPPGKPQLAPHDRRRLRPAAISRRRRAACHAGDPALARPPRPPRGSPPSPRAHHRRRGPRRPPPPGDRRLRPGGPEAGFLRGRQEQGAAVDERVARPSGPADAVRPPRAARRPGPPVLPAGVGRRCARAVRAAGVQPRRRHLAERGARRHHPPRRHQDGVHRHPALPRRPARPAPHAAHERGRHGRVSARARILPPRVAGGGGRRCRVVGVGDERGGRGGVHGDLLPGVRAGDMDVRVGDPAAPSARAGHRHRHGGEPGDERAGGDDVHLHVRGGGHGRELLHLRRVRGGGVGVRLRLPAGDQGEEPRGDGGALRRFRRFAIAHDALKRPEMRARGKS